MAETDFNTGVQRPVIRQGDAAPSGGSQLPDQSGQAGKVLTTDGTSLSWIATGGTGTVTSVNASVPTGFSISGNPITAAGTLAITADSQTASKFYASPTSSTAVPSFRAIVENDIPALGAAKITSGTIDTARLGSGTADNTTYLRGDSTWQTITSGGSVASVGLSMPSIFTVTGSPVTTTGTLAATLNSQAQNLVLASPTSGSGAVTFRSLDSSDIPSLAFTKITGTVPVLQGGTGQTTANASLNALLPTQTTHSGKYLTTNGTDTSWATVSGGSGTVTSVDASVPTEFAISGNPITTSGTLAISAINQTANTVWAGPTTGIPATPGFRSLVDTDIPSLPTSKITSGVFGTGFLGTGTADTTKFLRGDGSWQVNPLGTVTSVDASVPGEFAVSGNPITTSGTLAITTVTQTANTVWAGPVSGGALNPAFRALVEADIPNLAASKITSGTFSTSQIPSLDVSKITTGVFSTAFLPTIPLTLGGTGQTTANASLNALLPSQTGNSGKILSTDGTDTSWIASGGAGTVTSVSVTTANGVSGSVATATTTPAITITLGNITPSGLQVSGLTASQLTATDASKNIVSLSTTTYPSLTELTYVKGVTSDLQTQINAKGAGTVTSASVVSANGFAGSVATATTTPAITLSTSVTGLLKGNGTAISAATDGTDYLSSTTGVKLDQTSGQTIGATGARLTKLWATDITATNAIAGSVTGNAGTVTNATLTTALTVNTGTLTLTANAANTSVLTIGAGAVSVSGSNTGDQTSVSGNAGTATALQTARTIGGVSFDGTANITVASATGGFTVSGGNLALSTNSLTLTGSIASTGSRVTKGWFTDVESTNAPTVSGSSVYYAGGTDVAVADGGTGKSSWTQYLIPYADTTTSFSQIAIGSSGQVLTSNGVGSAPTFQAVSAPPGGSTTQVQYNNAGALGGISGVTTDGTKFTALAAAGTITLNTTGSGATYIGTGSNTGAITMGHSGNTAAFEFINQGGFLKTFYTSTLNNFSYTSRNYIKKISGTPTAGFGMAEVYYADTDTGVDKLISGWIYSLTDATNATYSSEANLYLAKSGTPKPMFGFNQDGEFKINGSTSGALSIKADPTTSTHTLKFPDAQGSSGTFLKNDGSGNLTWDTAGGAGDMILASAQTVTGAKTFGSAGDVGKLIIAGSTSGTTILDATAIAGSGTVVLPTTGTLSTLDGTETFTNKTLTSPTMTTPTLGVATATSINKLTITAPATSATLTIANGASLITAGAYSVTLTATATTTLTLPTSGTLMTNPMTTDGDVIYGGASGTPTRLANGSSGQVLTSAGGTSAPTWTTPAGLTGFTATLETASPNNTVNASYLLASGGSTNQDAVISPKGTGAFQLQLADGTSAGGDKRGQYAVDLQLARSSSAAVASANYSFAAGQDNIVSGYGGFAGGESNVVDSSYGVAIGKSNTAHGSAVAIGELNLAATNSVVMGYNNSSTTGQSVVLGQNNTASGSYSVCIGRSCNTYSSPDSVAIGYSCASSKDGAVALGYSTTASGYITFAAGQSTTASGYGATAAGGYQNTASGDYSFATGRSNTASGNYSFVSGYNSTASESYSTAFGVSKSNKYGQVSWGATVDTEQTSNFSISNTTTDATQTDLFCDGTAATKRMTIPNNTLWTFSMLISGRRSDASDGAGYKVEGVIENRGGTTALIGTITKTVLAESDATWDVDVVADDTNDALVVNVTGAAGKTIHWYAAVKAAEVS